MQAAKRSFDMLSQCATESSDATQSSRVALPFDVEPSSRTVLWSIVNNRFATSYMAAASHVDIREWLRIGMNIDFLHPWHSLFNKTDECSTEIPDVWKRFIIQLATVASARDVCAVFLVALFSNHEYCEKHLTNLKASGIMLDLSHVLSFSRCAEHEFFSIPQDAIMEAVLACFRKWGDEQLPFGSLLTFCEPTLRSQPHTADLIAEQYGHPWLRSWLGTRPHAACAGGAVVNAMRSQLYGATTEAGCSLASDIDIFVTTAEQWREAASSISGVLSRPCPVVVQGAVATWLCPDGANVQLIYSRGDCALDVVRLFDMDYVQVWCDAAGAHCTGRAAAALLTRTARIANGTVSTTKKSRIAKAADKGFAVSGVREEGLATIRREDAAYLLSKHCHLRNLGLTDCPADAERALVLARSLYHASKTAKAYHTIQDAFDDGFRPKQFGTVGSKRRHTAADTSDYPTADGEPDGDGYSTAAPSAVVLPAEDALANFAEQTHPPFDLLKHHTLYQLLPRVCIELGPLYCPFGFAQSSRSILLNVYGNRPNVGWFDRRRLNGAVARRLIDALSSHCDKALRKTNVALDDAALLRRTNAGDGSAAYYDIKAIRFQDAPVAVTDGYTGDPLSEAALQAGCIVDATVTLETLTENPYTGSAGGYLRLLRAKVYRPPECIFY
jgi:hypothetical protein